MAIAEGFTFKFEDESNIKADLLETFPYSGKKQTITYSTKEFSAVCPFSGLPDYGIFEMNYIPNSCIIELKSLKYYLFTYRNVGIYQEHATHKIFVDLESILNPQSLEIKLVYNTRGGIDTVTTIKS